MKKLLLFLIIIAIATSASATELVFVQDYCIRGQDCTLNDLFLTGNFSFIGAIVNVTIINQEVTGQLTVIGDISANHFVGNGSLLTGMPFTFWNIINFTNQLDNYLPYFWNKGNASAYYDGRTDRWQLANSTAQGYISSTLWNSSDTEVYLNDSTKSLRIENITSPFTNKSYITFFSDGSIGITLDPVESPPEESEQQSQQSKETKEYTRGTERTCKDGTCNLVLYSGTRFVEEDGKWKDIREARSLKEKGWNVVYLKDDRDHIIDVIDYNYTSITLNFSFVGNPLEYEYEVDDNKIKIKIKINETLFDEVTGEPYEKEIEYEVEIEEGKEIGFVYNLNPLGKKFTFGDKSTTIKLQDADTENLEDTYVYSQAPTNNYGLSPLFAVFAYSDPGYVMRSYIKFDISVIPLGQLIDDATLHLYAFASNLDQPVNIEVHHVYNQSWNEGTKDDATGSPNWGDQICKTGFDDSIQCNLTAEDTQICLGIDTWNSYTVINMLKTDYDTGNDNFSIVLKLDDEGDYYHYCYFNSKEYTDDITLRPYLNITYSEAVAEDTTPPAYSNFKKNITDANIFIDSAIQFNITIADADNNVLYWNFSTNLTEGNTWNNITNSTDLTDPSQVNVSIVSKSVGDVFGYMFCASDDQGNVGCDSLRTFEIQSVPIPPLPKRPKFFIQNMSGIKQWWVDMVGNSWLRGNLNITGNLDVGGEVNITNNLIVDTNTFFVDSASNLVGIGTITPQYKLQIADTTTKSLNVSDTLYVDGDNKRVGIGTDSPTAPLEVEGTLPGTVGGFPSGLLHVKTSDNSEFSNSVITGHNSFNTNTQLWYLGSTTGSNNDIAFINRQNSSLSLWTNNTKRMTILNTGNVGIGTTTPTSKLNVIGDINVTGNFTGNIIRGRMSMHAHPGEVVAIANPNVYVNITAFNESDVNGFTDGLTGGLIAEIDGHYDIGFVVCGSGGANNEYDAVFQIDGEHNEVTHMGEIHGHGRMSNANDIFCIVSSPGDICLVKGNNVTVAIKNEDAANDFIMSNGGVVITRIGDC